VAPGLRTGSGVSGSEEDPARAVVPLEVTQRPKPVGKRSRGPRDFYVLQTRNNIGYGNVNLRRLGAFGFWIDPLDLILSRRCDCRLFASDPFDRYLRQPNGMYP
jgi:hypothetical protein